MRYADSRHNNIEDIVVSRSQYAMNTITKESMYGWNDIAWKSIEKNVFKLQKRIYQASSRNDQRRVRKLQRLMMSSRSAKLLAVRKVTQDNQGKKTAGVDGVKSLTPPQRLLLTNTLRIEGKTKPVRRIWIPKPGTDEKRGLGIPTLQNRAEQSLIKLVLEPEWEARFETNSYGFRPGRSCHDAIEAIYLSIKSKPKYVLDADIEKCFDKICHEELLKKIKASPSIRRQIKVWLKAGVLDGEKLLPSEEGTMQGGPFTPPTMLQK
jgi:RNA-directed DNA polymerase